MHACCLLCALPILLGFAVALFLIASCLAVVNLIP